MCDKRDKKRAKAEKVMGNKGLNHDTSNGYAGKMVD